VAREPQRSEAWPLLSASAIILAIICIIVSVTYFVTPAGNLPTFMPGYEAASAHIHVKHAIIALVAAFVLILIGWLIGR
jgi:hypothetical protein